MKRYIFTIALSALCLYGHGQNSNRNYVKTRTFQNEAGSTYIDAVDYYDGLGRPVQTVNKGVTPARKDLVELQEYDHAGRPSNSWLPTPTAAVTSDLVPLSTFKTYAWNFYADSAYSRPVYEESPISRIKEQYGPGKDWYNQKKAARTTYLTNNTSDTLVCKKYIYLDHLATSSFGRSGNWPTGSLYVTRTEDAEGIIEFEFTNSQGQLILKRQTYRSIYGDAISTDTYFIYDNKGNLCFVLPFHASDVINTSLVYTAETAAMKAFGYSYEYDHRNRCVFKKLPGVEPVYYRYDNADRLIFMQDGENRKKGEWQFFIPDAQGRTVLTGICKNVINTNYISGNVTATFNANQTATKYYQVTGVTLASPTIMTANYYGHYDFLTKETFTQLGYNNISTYNTWYGDITAAGKYKHSGLLTGSIERILDETSNEKYQYKTFYYDYKGRLIQKGYNTLINGQIEREYISYNFTDQPIKEHMVTWVNGVQNMTQTYDYTYDHAGRLTRKTHSNSLRSGHQAIINYTYDEAGRMIKYNPGTTEYPSVHNYIYTYNTRGWQTGITGTHFIEHLQYMANGKISQKKWRPLENGKEFQYDFVYDGLARLREAKSNRGYDTEYTYCRQGNITYLDRYTNFGMAGLEKVRIDQLVYHYGQSNQLIGITDHCEIMSEVYESNDHISFPRPSGTGDSYAYDANGSMTRMLNRGITDIQYNHLNLPKLIDIKNPRAEGRSTYSYTAGGEKLRVVKRWNPGYSTNPVMGTPPNPATMTRSNTIDYIGNRRYEEGTLVRMMIGEGYFDKYSNDYIFYVRDYQGSTRATVRANGNRIQSYDNYPFGVNYNYVHTNELYKYTGKEFDHFNVLNLYDYGARMYDPGMARFTTMDPMAEKYYHISPYAYCANDPVNHIDPDGRDIWIHYQDNNGKDQRIAYTAGMNYNGNNDFVSKSISYLNAINSYGGSKMIGGLINSPNNFNIKNQLPIDRNGNSISGTLQFKEFASGGGNIYAGDLMTSGHYANIENLSHELFHGIQHENGQGGSSIYNEVEAYVYSGIVSLNWMIETGNWGGSANGQGFNNPSGKAYRDAFKSLLNHYSTQNFNKAVDNFKGGAVKNNSGLYDNVPLRRNNQKKSMLEKYYPQ